MQRDKGVDVLSAGVGSNCWIGLDTHGKNVGAWTRGRGEVTHSECKRANSSDIHWLKGLDKLLKAHG